MSLGENIGCETGSRTGSSGMNKGVVPKITYIVAEEDNPIVYVYFNYQIDKLTDFFAGMSFSYSGTPIAHSLVALTLTQTRLEYTLAKAPTAGQTVLCTYDATSGDIFGRVYNIPLPDQSKSTAIDPPSVGEIFSDNFESYSEDTGITESSSGWTTIGGQISLVTTGGNPGQHLRCSYTGQATGPYTVSKNIESLNLAEVYVKFDFRADNGELHGAKFLKLFGVEISTPIDEPANKANSTNQLEYIDNDLDRIIYGRGETTDNDADSKVKYDGTNTSDPFVVIDPDYISSKFSTPTSGWHSFQLHMKYNTDDNRDGVYEVWIDNVQRLKATNVKNRHNSNIRKFWKIEICGYSDGRVTPYTDWHLDYDNVVMSTRYIT